MKTKSAISLLIVVVLVAALGTLAITGLEIGVFRVKPLAEGISQGLDLRGGVYAVYEAKDEGQEDFNSLLTGTMAVLRTRLVDKGYTEAVVSQQGVSRIRVEIPDVDDPNEILKIVGQPAVLEFKDPEGNVVMTGEAITNAKAALLEGQYVVDFTLNDAGSKAFAEATSANLQKQITIELDGQIISAPTVESAITGGSGFISGNMSMEEAQNLAMLIQSGALPLSIEQLEMRTISPTLGEDALSTSVRAALIGIILVLVFMVVLYRLPGLIACISLCVYMLIDLFLIAVIPGIQLTLPGIAGIVLSIGMAVDANIIIFERMKDELRTGKSVSAAMESGFSRAFGAIFDSNLTTILAGLVLMIFGAGSVKGFAITLTIGVVCSMFTAIVVTRFLLRKMVGLGVTKKGFYGVSEKKLEATAQKKQFSFTKAFKLTALVPAALIVIGVVVSAAMGGLNLGIDFTGGTMMTFEMKQDFNLDDVKAQFEQQGIEDAVYATSGSGAEAQAIVRMRDLDDPEMENELRASIEDALQLIYPEAKFLNIERVGAVAGRELVQNAIVSVAIACVLMLCYIWFRFKHLQFGVTAVVALVVDVAVMIAVVGLVRWQINSSFIAAVLTIVGYAINDTIVIFDRIRENRRKYNKRDMNNKQLADLSVSETLTRTIFTTITTLLTIVTLYVLGVESIKEFALPIIIGILAGIFNSIFVSPSLWGIWMDKQDEAKAAARTGGGKAGKA